MIYIFAGTYKQAQFCAYENGLAEGSWKFIHDYQTLQGTENAIVWKTGSYQIRDDYDMIQVQIIMNHAEVINKPLGR